LAFIFRFGFLLFTFIKLLLLLLELDFLATNT
jgi:hypothetical protein